MPNPRQFGHRWRYGTFPASGITSGYAIEAIAPQSDQLIGSGLWLPWIAPREIAAPVYARVAGRTSGLRIADGPRQWTWLFDQWTFGMYSYVLSTFFPSNVWSAPASIMTYDDTDTAIFLNAFANRPQLVNSNTASTSIQGGSGGDVGWALGGYAAVKVSFTRGVIVT